jgi:hypothetical protein
LSEEHLGIVFDIVRGCDHLPSARLNDRQVGPFDLFGLLIHDLGATRKIHIEVDEFLGDQVLDQGSDFALTHDPIDYAVLLLLRASHVGMGGSRELLRGFAILVERLAGQCLGGGRVGVDILACHE